MKPEEKQSKLLKKCSNTGKSELWKSAGKRWRSRNRRDPYLNICWGNGQVNLDVLFAKKLSHMIAETRRIHFVKTADRLFSGMRIWRG